jgi:cellulose synthase/poly-beta-1,6-N-acetylglucosamine synthase-like glycosyltransferase
MEGPYLSTVSETIQAAIAPVFLLAGIGAFLNVMVGRLARIVDRARNIEQLHPRSTGPEHDRHVWELRIIDRRISVINNAIFLCVASGLAICLVVAMMFVARLTNLHVGIWVASSFIISMLLLMAGLIYFLVEVRMSLEAIHVREELLELEGKKRK